MGQITDLQLLNFMLADDIFGLDITKVQEIRALGEVRALPYSPEYCIGVIEFRDHMVPILDLRILFDYQGRDINKQTVVIISSVNLEESHMLLGTVVDSVSDVISIDPSKLKQPPAIGNQVESECVTGMFKSDDKIILLLTLESLITGQALGSLQDLVAQDESTPES